MDKKWYIEIQGNREGPYSFEDLKRDPRLTPDTLVWKEGFKRWKPIREVSELKHLFKDEPSPQVQEENADLGKSRIDEELTLDLGREPPYLFWILIALIVIGYLMSRIFLQ